MKLIVLFLAAVCCSLGFAEPQTKEKRKLVEVMRELALVRKTLQTRQHNETMLNSPPKDVENCCCLPALECFHANLMIHFNGTNKFHKKLNRSLNSSITKSGVEYCPSGNNTATCHDCNSHPKVNVKEFFDRLQSLIQRALSRPARG